VTASPDDDPHIARFDVRGDFLRVEIAGHRRDFEAGIGVWRELGRLTRARGATRLLVISRLTGPLPSAEEQRSLMRGLVDSGFEGVRTALVVSDSRTLADLEHGEMEARELGQESRVFSSEKQAEVWLLYGESGRR
jgi:hypothetical protein